MRISYRYNFIYIHVDRTGGTSISSALDPFSYHLTDFERLKAAVFRRLGLTESSRWKEYSTQHVKATELKKDIPAAFWDKCFKFAFTRNPWDWALSIYYARLQHPAHREYELVRYLGNFESYIDWWIENRATQQTDYIFDQNGNLIVDFVGRFEFLNQDFESICKKIGIDVKLSRLNRAIYRKHDYRNAYNTRLIEKVARLFPNDIALGYEFESSLASPITRQA